MTTAKTLDRNIAPGPKGNFLLGSLLDMQRQGMIEFYVDNWKKYGDIVQFKMGPMSTFLLAIPVRFSRPCRTGPILFREATSLKSRSI